MRSLTTIQEQKSELVGQRPGFEVIGSSLGLGNGHGNLHDIAGFPISREDLAQSVAEDDFAISPALIVLDKDVQRTAEWARVPLTGVVLDDWQQGYEAARMLHGILEGNHPDPALVRIKPSGVRRRESTGSPTTQDPLVAKALHLIQGPLGGTYSVDDIVTNVAASRRTLEVRFRKSMGQTLHEALSSRRIGDAKRARLSDNATVTEVAEACGYSSVHYFSSAFRRTTGLSPNAWRRQQTQPDQNPIDPQTSATPKPSKNQHRS